MNLQTATDQELWERYQQLMNCHSDGVEMNAIEHELWLRAELGELKEDA